MKAKSAIFIALLTLGATARAEGGPGRFGIGFVLGEPVALSAKYMPNPEKALDLQVSFSSREYTVVYGDYLFQFPGLFGRADWFVEQLVPYVGFGPLAVIANKSDHAEGEYFDKRTDSFALGGRIPLGVEWIWDRAPLGIGVEFVPGIVVAPATSGILQGGLTLRYYF